MPVKITIEVKNLQNKRVVFNIEYPLNIFGLDHYDEKNEVEVRVTSILNHMKLTGDYKKDFRAFAFKKAFIDILIQQGYDIESLHSSDEEKN